MAELNNVFSQISAQFKSMDGFVQRARGFPVVPSWLVSSKYKSFFTLKKKSLAPTSSDSLQLPPQLPNMEERGVFSPAVLSNILLLSSISQSQRMHGGCPGIQITAVWKISSKRLQKKKPALGLKGHKSDNAIHIIYTHSLMKPKPTSA